MDRERARFVLRSFRPDGADTEGSDFAEALRLAISDRELGEWLVRERAFDAEFAECLARVDLPEGLRSSVLLAMVQGGSEFPKVDREGDRRMMEAMISVKIPEGLRVRVLESMEQTAKVSPSLPRAWMRFGIPLAAAAGIALAFIFIGHDKAEKNIPAISASRISVEAVEAGFVSVYESPRFSLDETGSSQRVLISHLKKRGLPCGDLQFPPGLDYLKGLGCRELDLDGKRGSLICLDEKGAAVHLIIFLRKDIEGELPDIANPNISQSGNWAKASWGNDRYAFALMALRNSDDMKAFF